MFGSINETQIHDMLDSNAPNPSILPLPDSLRNSRLQYFLLSYHQYFIDKVDIINIVVIGLTRRPLIQSTNSIDK